MSVLSLLTNSPESYLSWKETSLYIKEEKQSTFRLNTIFSPIKLNIKVLENELMLLRVKRKMAYNAIEFNIYKFLSLIVASNSLPDI